MSFRTSYSGNLIKLPNSKARTLYSGDLLITNFSSTNRLAFVTAANTSDNIATLIDTSIAFTNSKGIQDNIGSITV